MATARPDLVELDRLTQEMPELGEAAAFYRAVTPVLRQYRQMIDPFRMDLPSAQLKLESGIPLLVGEELPFDPASARALFISLCKAVENARMAGKPAAGEARQGPRRSVDVFALWNRARDGDGNSLRMEATRQIRRAVERNDLDIQQVWGMLTGGEWRKLELTASSLKLDASLLRELTRLSLKPAFQLWSEGLQESVGFERWKGGYCPVCGSSPSLSEIVGKEAARRLRCGLCGASWHYPHLKCAFCQNDDYKQLIYLTVDGEEGRYKVQACEACRGYIKIIKTFDPIPVEMLPVQDLATIHLDLIAADYDFSRVNVS